MKVFKYFVQRKYYKYDYVTFARPNMTACNHNIGGGSFAVRPERESDSYVDGDGKCFRAFDGNASTAWGTYKQSAKTGHACIIYNPNPIRLTSMQLTFISGGMDSGGKHTATYVEVSNNGSSFTRIFSQGETTTTTQTLNLSSNTNYYKYYRLEVVMPGGDDHDGIKLKECVLTGTERQTISGTSSDYDFYIDVYKYKPIIASNKYYALKS